MVSVSMGATSGAERQTAAKVVSLVSTVHVECGAVPGFVHFPTSVADLLLVGGAEA